MKNNHLYAHIDVRNFYAVCEQSLNTDYKGKPVVVYNESSRGNRAIIAVSKEAKENGIMRGTSIEKAKKLKGVILVKSRLEDYEKKSNELYQICIDYLGDEVFSISKPHIDDIVMKLPNELETAIGLTKKVEMMYDKLGFELAIGISFNEEYAHIATKLAKKFGVIRVQDKKIKEELPLIYIGKSSAENMVYKLPITDFPGIGPKRKEKLNTAGIEIIEDIANSTLNLMIKLLGPTIGSKIYFSVLGLENPKLQLDLFED